MGSDKGSAESVMLEKDGWQFGNSVMRAWMDIWFRGAVCMQKSGRSRQKGKCPSFRTDSSFPHPSTLYPLTAPITISTLDS